METKLQKFIHSLDCKAARPQDQYTPVPPTFAEASADKAKPLAFAEATAEYTWLQDRRTARPQDKFIQPYSFLSPDADYNLLQQNHQ
jgi:hypothetical protein